MRIDTTPIEYLMTAADTRIYIKRDDLIPFSFGGNKVRIADCVFREMESKGCDTVISYGSRSSNLNRVIAHMAAREKKNCIVILKKEENEPETFNERMIRESGAVIVKTEPENVRKTVQEVLSSSRKRGEYPYYIYGDETGKGGEDVLRRAYAGVFREICSQEEQLSVHFDRIYVPVGTGSTYEGLLSACDPGHRITGISIARTHEDAGSLKDGSYITDEYRMGGYGKYGPEIGELILRMISVYGIPMDPTYTGKAFYGMLKETEKGTGDRNVLFIHTGGAPLFFDFIRNYKEVSYEL